MEAKDIDAGRQRWQQRYDAALTRGQVRDADFTTLSGVDVDPVYGPPPGAVVPGFDRIGWPGEYPFTRGLHPTGYRGRPWTIRQFAGFGNAEQTNERYRDDPGRRRRRALAWPSTCPRSWAATPTTRAALGEVGHCGVAIDSAADMEVLFDGIPLGDVTTSMTISGPAVPVFCMYVVAAERQGVDPSVLDGTLQTDIFKEYIAQKEWLFPPEPHLRLIGDLMEWCADRVPAVQAAVGVRVPHPRGRVDGRAGARVHPGRRVRLRGARAGPRAGRRRVRPRAVVLLRRAHRLLRGDRQVPGRPPDLGPLDARRVRRDDRARPSGCASTPRRPGCR